MDNSHLLAVVVFRVLERVLGHALGSFLGNKLYALDNAIDDLVLNTRVLALGVLTNGDDVHVIVQRLVALEAAAGTYVGVKVEFLAQRQVQRAVTLADGRHEGTLQADLVRVNGVDGGLRDSELAIGTLFKTKSPSIIVRVQGLNSKHVPVLI